MDPLAKHPEVVYTELENGAVLLHMESGFYYSLDRVGLEIWRLIGAAAGVDEIGRALAARFDVDENQAAAAAARFIDTLARERLLAPAESPSGATREALSQPEVLPGDRQPFTEPVLAKHDEPLHQISAHPFDPQLPLAE